MDWLNYKRKIIYHDGQHQIIEGTFGGYILKTREEYCWHIEKIEKKNISGLVRLLKRINLIKPTHPER